eukprot:2572990-Amphidinium_carterae.1
MNARKCPQRAPPAERDQMETRGTRGVSYFGHDGVPERSESSSQASSSPARTCTWFVLVMMMPAGALLIEICNNPARLEGNCPIDSCVDQPRTTRRVLVDLAMNNDWDACRIFQAKTILVGSILESSLRDSNVAARLRLISIYFNTLSMRDSTPTNARTAAWCMGDNNLPEKSNSNCLKTGTGAQQQMHCTHKSGVAGYHLLRPQEVSCVDSRHKSSFTQGPGDKDADKGGARALSSGFSPSDRITCRVNQLWVTEKPCLEG